MEGNCAPQTHRQVEYIVGPKATSVVTANNAADDAADNAANNNKISINQENLQTVVAQILQLLGDRQNVQELLQLLGDRQNVQELSRLLDDRQNVLQGLFTEEKEEKEVVRVIGGIASAEPGILYYFSIGKFVGLRALYVLAAACYALQEELQRILGIKVSFTPFVVSDSFVPPEEQVKIMKEAGVPNPYDRQTWTAVTVMACLKMLGLTEADIQLLQMEYGISTELLERKVPFFPFAVLVDNRVMARYADAHNLSYYPLSVYVPGLAECLRLTNNATGRLPASYEKLVEDLFYAGVIEPGTRIAYGVGPQGIRYAWVVDTEGHIKMTTGSPKEKKKNQKNQKNQGNQENQGNQGNQEPKQDQETNSDGAGVSIWPSGGVQYAMLALAGVIILSINDGCTTRAYENYVKRLEEAIQKIKSGTLPVSQDELRLLQYLWAYENMPPAWESLVRATRERLGSDPNSVNSLYREFQLPDEESVELRTLMVAAVAEILEKLEKNEIIVDGEELRITNREELPDSWFCVISCLI